MYKIVPKKNLGFDGWHVGQFSKVSQVVVVEKTSLNTVLCDDCDAATSAAAAVTVDCKRHALFHQFNAFLLAHALTVVGIHEAIKVGAARTTN